MWAEPAKSPVQPNSNRKIGGWTVGQILSPTHENPLLKMPNLIHEIGPARPMKQTSPVQVIIEPNCIYFNQLNCRYFNSIKFKNNEIIH